MSARMQYQPRDGRQRPVACTTGLSWRGLGHIARVCWPYTYRQGRLPGLRCLQCLRQSPRCWSSGLLSGAGRPSGGVNSPTKDHPIRATTRRTMASAAAGPLCQRQRSAPVPQSRRRAETPVLLSSDPERARPSPSRPFLFQPSARERVIFQDRAIGHPKIRILAR